MDTRPDCHADYAHWETMIYPLARKLYEEMVRREWNDAFETSTQLSDVVYEIRRIALANKTD